MLKLIRYLFILPIVLYQKLISPLLPGSCIYSPTCSNYTKKSIENHGIFKGLFLGTMRVLRCTDTFFSGGEDPVPKEFSFDYIKSSYSKFRRSKRK